MSKKLSTQFENNRENILNTTADLFCSKGVGATSISDIAKAAKLSKGTVSYYFPSKDHLIFETTEHHLSDTTNSILNWIETTVPGTPLPQALFCLVTSIFNTEEKCRLHICLIYEAIMGNKTVEKMISDRTAKWRTMVEAGLLKSDLDHARTTTNALFLTLDTVILRKAMGILDMSEQDICVQITNNI